ncbi:hypothetical protein ABIF37_005827 [Bradyrhizobium diazoefficiens]
MAASSVRRIDVDLARLERLLAGEGEQVLGQLRAALGGVVDQLGDGGELGTIGDRIRQNTDRAGDDGQHVVEVVGDAAGQLADRIHLLDLPELGFGGLLLGEVAADEEMAPHRLGPGAHPVQRNLVTIVVIVARLEAALDRAAPGRAHLAARFLEVIRVDELDRTVPDHVVRAEAEDVLHTGADLDEIAETIGDQDQILRGLENALALLDLPIERHLRSLPLGDVAGHLGRADDLALGRSQRDLAQHHVDGLTALVQPYGLLLVDDLAVAGAGQILGDIVTLIVRHDDVDGTADRLVGGVAEDALGRAVPGRDGAVERLGDDGVVGGFDDGGEQPLALGVIVALGVRSALQRADHARGLRLEADILDQEHREHEGRRAEAVEAADVEAEIEARDVHDRRECDIEQPGAHHDHEPDVDHRMRPAEPERDEGGKAERPYEGYDADHGRHVVAVAQQDREQIVPGGDDPGEDGHGGGDAEHDGADRPDCRAADPGAAVGLLQPGIAQHEHREAAVPDHVEPDRGLPARAEKSGRGEQSGEGEGMNQRRGGGEQIAAREPQQRAGPQDRKLRQQQHRGDDVAYGEGRLIARDKGRDGQERGTRERDGQCEQDC